MGRYSGLATALSTVADKLRTQREAGEEQGRKINLLGYAGMAEGKITRAQPNEEGAFELTPGSNQWFKRVSPEMDILNRVIPQGQVGRQQGQNLMGQDWKMNKIDLGPVTLERTPTEIERQAEITQAAEKAGAIEAAKPYTELEAGVISKGKLLVPQIDKLIELVEKNKIYEGLGVPFGASRIAAFGEKGPWQAVKRGWTGGKGREAGILLKDIKILACGEGGKTLSENERMTALSNIDPSYKTEAQWVDGLKQAKALLQEKAKLMTKKLPIGNKEIDLSSISNDDLERIAGEQ